MVKTVLAIVVIILGLVCWLGQALALVAPRVAVKLGLDEPKEDVDRSMYLFERFSQGIMDVLLAWTLPASAFMMLLGYPHWPILALVGGGVYLYFPGVFSITRIALKKNGLKIGRPASEVSAYVFGTLWTLSAVYMIALAVAELVSDGY
jgi:hypothetical protein